MTTAGSTRPAHGTRYEFVLVESDGNARAVYEARVFRAEFEASARVELTAQGARLLDGGEGFDEAARAQLLALAKTLAKHATDSVWPRRVLRWRQPGVR